MPLYTRTGDHGTTGTLWGRTSKHSTQVAALGALDTLHAHLAVAYEEAHRTPHLSPAFSLHIAKLADAMHDLLDIGTHVSALHPVTTYHPILRFMPQWTYMDISSAKYEATHFSLPVDLLELKIDELEAHTPPLSQFILHTGTPLTAFLHVARASCRSAEASLIAFLGEADHVELREQPLLAWLNRLSDYLFALARMATFSLDGLETSH